MMYLKEEFLLADQPTVKVSALHALAYCPRLFYLEEVEELYTQDASVFAGRRLHVELDDQEEGEWEELFLESEALGLRGRVDALRKHNRQLIPYEHKRGKPNRTEAGEPLPWDSDRLQILAYALLMETALGVEILEGRIRYHADNVLVHVPLTDVGRQEVREAIAQARQLRQAPLRPPVTPNERLCTRCSLAPVCLPEEARLAHDREWQPVRLFPADDERQIIHILEPGTRVGRSGEQLKIAKRNEPDHLVPIQQVGQVVLHSFSQISTQALHMSSTREIGVHLISGGGRYMGSFDTRQGSIQRRLGQYRALSNATTCLRLAQALVRCRGKSQRQFIMRVNRGLKRPELQEAAAQIKVMLNHIERAEDMTSLLGVEGNIAALYFAAFPAFLAENTPGDLRFTSRSRRPPRDRVNAMLSFGYALLLKDVMNAILTVGLEPALGFYHQPRSQAAPLALDLMEIFRVPLVDMPIVASINRQQWEVQADFTIRGEQVWLSDVGKRKFIDLYEQRKQDSWKHPVTGYSLSYQRLLELEVRLLEKEWNGEGGLFAQLVLR